MFVLLKNHIVSTEHCLGILRNLAAEFQTNPRAEIQISCSRNSPDSALLHSRHIRLLLLQLATPAAIRPAEGKLLSGALHFCRALA